MINQNVGPMNQANAAAMNMGPNQAIAQRQPGQNPASAMLNQAMNAGNMNAGNINALQQMKQSQQQLGGAGVFSGMVQQRQQQVQILITTLLILVDMTE